MQMQSAGRKRRASSERKGCRKRSSTRKRRASSERKGYRKRSSTRKRRASNERSDCLKRSRLLTSTTLSTNPSRANRQRKIDQIYLQLTKKNIERVASKQLVNTVLGRMLQHASEQNGGHIYKQVHEDADTHDIRVNFSQGYKFDANIPLHVNIVGMRLDGCVRYQFDSQTTGLNKHTGTNSLDSVDKLIPVYLWKPKIPVGYAVLEVERNLNSNHERKQLPDKFLHGHENPGLVHTVLKYMLNVPDVVNSSASGNIELLPCDVKCDIHEKLTKTSIPGVTVKETSNDSSLSFHIRPPRAYGITHDIDVDVTVSVSVDKPMSNFGWPRPESVLAFGNDQIKAAEAEGLCLMPQKDLFWAISFSRIERGLLSAADGDHCCRQYVYKLMKNFVRSFYSNSVYSFNGMSHSVKTQVLWSCERHCYDGQYWFWSNRDECLINTLKEYKRTLMSGHQMDYFNTGIDILSGKGYLMCIQLAMFLNGKLCELEQMY